MHGSKGGRPIVHGINSKRLEKVKESIRDKIELHMEQRDPEDVREEMAVLRAFLDMAIEKHGDLRVVGIDKDGNVIQIPIDSTGAVTMLADTIRKTAASRTQMRNSTALTAAELLLIQARLAEVIREFVPKGRWPECAERIEAIGGLLEGAQ